MARPQRAAVLAAAAGLLLLCATSVTFCPPARAAAQPRSRAARAGQGAPAQASGNDGSMNRRGLGLGLGVALGLALGLASAPKPSSAKIKGIWTAESTKSLEPSGILNVKLPDKTIEVCPDPESKQGGACKKGDAKYDPAALNQVGEEDRAKKLRSQADSD